MNKANNYLIDQIKQRIDGSPADILADILPLSKEAIYRRLRGEVLFSLDEAVIVARELNISLDTIGTKEDNFCTFELTMPPFETDAAKAYVESIKKLTNIIEEYKQEGVMFYQIRPSLPPQFVWGYDNLLKFYYLRWLYLARGLEPFVKQFASIALPDTLLDGIAKFVPIMNSFDTTILLSELAFEYLLKEINHFHSLNILNKDDIILITNDLHVFINDLEKLTAKGQRPEGNKFNIYLIDSIQDSTFGFTEGAKKEIAYVKLIDVNQGITENKTIYNMFRRAFYDMKDYATLISESGSVKRTAFFAKQRALVDEFIVQYF